VTNWQYSSFRAMHVRAFAYISPEFANDFLADIHTDFSHRLRFNENTNSIYRETGARHE